MAAAILRDALLALSSALTALLDDYLLFLTQLEARLMDSLVEHQEQSSDGRQYGLGTLWTLAQPTFLRLKLLSQLVHSINASKATGGQLLDILYSFACRYSGDLKAKQLFSFLLQKATKPYLRILSEWIHTGTLVDPYDEFFVVKRASNKAPSSDGLVEWWWTCGFQIRRKSPNSAEQTQEEVETRDQADSELLVPSFLSTIAEKSLSTGKYWHVLLACGKNVEYGAAPFELDLSNIFKLKS